MSTAVQVLLFLAGIVVFGVVMSWVESRRMGKRLKEVFSGRRPLDEQAFHDKYFKKQGIPADIVIKMRRIFEKRLGVDLSCLSAEDEFMGNLGFLFESDDFAGIDIVIDLEKEFDIRLSDEETASVRTFREAVEKVWEKIEETTPESRAGGCQREGIWQA